MTARLLMVALDAADSRLLEQWADTGVLPNLAALRARGATRHLVAPVGASDDALWASFHYGVPLGEHGRYHHRIPLAPAGSADGDSRAFWMDHGNVGRRVAVIDLPKGPPPQPMHGIYLADWLVHGRIAREPVSSPLSLAPEIVRRFGEAPPSRCRYRQPALDDDDVREIAAHLLTSVSMKRAAGIELLASEHWDLFLIGFKEAHCAGHGLWDFVDSGHARHDAARNARLGEPVRTVFQALDAAVGDLASAAGPGAELVVFSTSDMEPNGALGPLLQVIVEALNRALWRRHASWPSRAIGQLAARARKPRFCEVLPYNENFGALRVAGGNADGQILDEVETLLRELVDPATGRPIIDAVTRPARELLGARAAALPDLLLHYRANAFPRAAVSPRLGRMTTKRARMRPGNHAGGGVVFAAGDRVVSSLDTVAALEDFAGLVSNVLA